ncbi:class I SAM-dependent methyltransferase [Actinoplanes couchii]|uniref:SAM-dependent methyltransferase n=1 Tax=Actinoplanes couchii TaxID=403638 RepID=A0ABQ3X812_9ACTN|nr:SAM-dependent methyltransferase [Actinoplanes couchii]
MYRAAASAGLTYNSPLGEHRAADLTRRLAPAGADRRALDLGCGSGELLMRLCEAHGIGGDGVESDPTAGDRARQRAAERGLSGRVTFHSEDASGWSKPADLVVNVGSSHIWGDAGQALTALHALTAPGGKALFADGIYRTTPGDTVHEMFGDLPDLAALTRSAVDAGFRPLHIAESTLAEWDDFESDWLVGVEHIGTPPARAFADARRDGYLNGYRGVVGFAWLILTPA